jgi:hypothetical protein
MRPEIVAALVGLFAARREVMNEPLKMPGPARVGAVDGPKVTIDRKYFQNLQDTLRDGMDALEAEGNHRMVVALNEISTAVAAAEQLRSELAAKAAKAKKV